jgi:hypothetical protein
MNINYFLRDLLEPFSFGLCFLFLLFFSWKNNKGKWRTLTIYYFLATLLMVKAAFAYPNIEIYSLLILLTSICLATYFYYTLLLSWKKKLVIMFCMIQSSYYILGNFIFTPPKILDSTGYVILSISIVLMAFMYMHQILTNVTDEPLSWNLDFWFVSSQLVYYLGSFFIFLTYGYLTQKILPSGLYSYENRMYISQLWRVHNVLLFLSSLIISAGIIWISFRRRSRSL